MPWIKLFDSLENAISRVPNQTSKLVKIGDRRICLVNHDGRFFALNDRCPHRGASLNEGIVNYLGEVICPLHEYRFSSKTGTEVSNQCDAVATHAIKVTPDGVYIDIHAQ